VPDSPAAVHAAHRARGELAYPVDADGRPLWPPRVRGAAWRVSAGLATVYATTTSRPRDGEPYDVSLVDLDEGFRMMSRVVGGGRIGQRVRLAWDGDVPIFVPVPVPADAGIASSLRERRPADAGIASSLRERRAEEEGAP
jgi:hypothetical protein